eukprot:GGOE01000775.1.p1 GENE.GGOE01000775.1~~GGOE01000775.1.p1  ORF type:complete len:282 (-),score=28.84 GGOE01000775.1:122-967(-)
MEDSAPPTGDGPHPDPGGEQATAETPTAPEEELQKQPNESEVALTHGCPPDVPRARSQEVILKTMQLCHQCRGTRNDLRPGGSGCQACQSTGLVPKAWLRCVKCNGSGNDPNEPGIECQSCGSSGHIKDFSRRPCFKCGGSGNDERCTSIACSGCGCSGYIASELQRCFKCNGTGTDSYSASLEGCSACGGYGHLPGDVTRCPQCKGSGMDPDSAAFGCSACTDRGFLGSYVVDSGDHQGHAELQKQVEPDPLITGAILFALGFFPVLVAVLVAYWTSYAL